MTMISKTRRTVFCSLLFVAIACQSFAATRSNLQIAESDNPREALKKSIYAFHNVKSYRARMECKYDASKPKPAMTYETAMTVEFVSPDRTRMLDKSVEMIYIGKDVYIKFGDEPWKKYERSESFRDSTTRARALEKKIKAIDDTGDVEFVGRDVIEGVPTLVYNWITYSGPNKTKPKVTKYWIGTADGLKRREQSECCSGSDNAAVVQTDYDYNADIKIEPPTKYEAVKEPIRDGVVVGIIAIPDPARDSGTDTGGGIGAGTGGGIGPGSGRGFSTGGPPPVIGSGTNPNPNAPATNVDQRPLALNNPQPRYTEEARKNKIQGIVLARVLIGADGTVKKATITRGLPDGLDAEAIQTAYQMRFKPAMKNGQPVAFLLTVQIEFNLH